MTEQASQISTERSAPRRRWLRAVSAIVVVLVLLPLAVFALILRSTVPPLTGISTVPGLRTPVEIVYGPDAVPHVLAGTAQDAYRALGFLHAQHRLWQMELMRRAGQGRLSEVFGSSTIDRDKFLRTLDLYGHAERSLNALSPTARSALDAYSAGVNAWLGRSTSLLEPRLPPEFLFLAYTPEPWRPADSLVVLKMMALQLARNLNKEVDRLTFAALGLSASEIEDLMSTEVRWGAPPLPDLRSLYPLRRPDRSPEHAALGFAGDGASNNWVVAGSRTKSGRPLLANDPHLRLTAPSTWYLAHLAIGTAEAPANLVGASLPGVPLILLGRADDFAWGMTNTESDVQDLYVERINPANSDEYATPDGWRAFERDEAVIRVRFADDVKLIRRRTRHGPVISHVYRNLDGLLAPGYVAALQWVALTDDDTTFEAGLFDVSMRTVADAIARTHASIGPMQSIVIADTAGSIALVAPGRIPVRDPANTIAGRAPVPGWDAAYDWKGYLPFDALPRRENPPSGVLATTNTRIVPTDYPHLLTWDWPPASRQQRIEELLLPSSDHDMASMRAAQLDIVSLHAVRLKTAMIAGARNAGSREKKLLDDLERWDGAMRAGLVEPLHFTAWLKHVIELVWTDDLGSAAGLAMDERLLSLLDLLEGRAVTRDWCDDMRTPEHETCADILTRALDAGLADLTRRYGSDRSGWTWGAAHYADNLHEPLGRLPWLGGLFNVRVPSDGGLFTLNRGAPDLRSDDPYANRSATTFRAIFDLADLESSLFIHSTGQSGNPLSVHYRGFAELWRRGDYITIPTDRAVIKSRRIGRWELQPTGADARR